MNHQRVLLTLLAINILLAGSTVSLTSPTDIYLDEQSEETFTFVENNIGGNTFAINTQGCIIPNINPNYRVLRTFLDIASVPPQCSKYHRSIFTNNRTHIYTVQDNLRFHKIKNKSDLVCCYKSFYRPSLSLDLKDEFVDNRVIYSKCKIFQDVIEVKDEFVKVHCYYKNKILNYKQFFTFTPKKAFTPNREDPFNSNDSMYNVLIMGLGSISRQNFHRTMPKTWNALRNIGAIELKGYNTISAANTFQNVMAVLLGMNKTEMIAACWPNPNTTLDNCPFIWERFKDEGYYTALAEDVGKLSIFHRKNFGFRGTPTDYYTYPFMHQFENFAKTNKKPALSLCMAEKNYFEYLLDYVKGLTTTLNSWKLFGLFWETSMSHHNFNYPISMDGPYTALIHQLKSSGYLNKTFLFLLSDHGMNTLNLNLTERSDIERRLPFVFIVTPNSFRHKYPLAYQNLQLNKKRLTTPYDVHATLVDLLYLRGVSNNDLIMRIQASYSSKRGISLFLPIPSDRTCRMAEISDQWCSCYNYISLSPSEPVIVAARVFLYRHINDQLAYYPQCAKADLILIESHELIPGYKKETKWRDFIIIFKLMPVRSIFEAIVRYDEGWQLYTIKELKSKYENNCVMDSVIKSYCSCLL